MLNECPICDTDLTECPDREHDFLVYCATCGVCYECADRVDEIDSAQIEARR